MRIDADAGAARRMIRGDSPGRGHERLGILGVDSAFDGVAAAHDVALPKSELLAGCNAQLLLHEVDARDQLSDRMLHLDARVHLDEEELAVLIQELECPGAAIVDLAAGVGSAFADSRERAQRDVRSGSLLDDLLMPTLHRAIALEQVDGVLVLVGQYLDLDVARVLEVFLQVHRWIAECRACFRLRKTDRRQQRGFRVDHAHPAAAAAAGRLDDHRVFDLARELDHFLRVVRQRANGPGHARHAGFGHRNFRAHLVAHEPNRVRTRADEDKAAFLDFFGEVGVFREEAVARMDRLRVGHFRCTYDRRDVEVAQRRWRRTDANRFIGKAYVLRVGVSLGMHDHRLDAQLAAGALNPQCDLASIGDQDLVEQLPVGLGRHELRSGKVTAVSGYRASADCGVDIFSR